MSSLLAVAALAQGRARGITLDVKDLPAKDVIVKIGLMTRADLRLDQEFNQKPVTLKVKDVPMRECLDLVAATIGAQVYQRGGDTHIVAPWKHKQLTALHGNSVTVDFQGQSVVKILGVIATYSGASMVIDPELPPGLEGVLKANNLTAADAINKLLAPHNAQYDLRYGVAFIATRARLAKLPKLPPVKGDADADYLFSFENQAGLPVIEAIAKRAGLTPEIQPDIKKVLEQAKYTAQMKDVSFRNALACILAPVGAEAEVAGKKLVIRRRAGARVAREDLQPDRKK